MSPRSGIRSVDFKIAPCCDDDVGRFASHFKLPTANALANSIVAPRDGRVELTFVVARPISMIHGHTRCGAADWRPASHYLRSAASPALWDWLLDTGSLTHRLRQRCRCGEAFRVAVRRLCWARLAADSWGRRSVVRLQGRPLLVTEIFLPALLQPHPSAAVAPRARRVIAEAST